MNLEFEMTQAQARALQIYCDSANIHNDYKAKTFEEIATQLKREGYKASSSSVQRWSKKFQFEEHLQIQIQSSLITDKDKKAEHNAITRDVTKKLVDIQRNNELTADCYELMELFTKQVADTYDRTGNIKRDDIKIVKDIAVFTGGREDKLLDRLANTQDEKLSSADMLEQFDTIDVEIEE